MVYETPRNDRPAAAPPKLPGEEAAVGFLDREDQATDAGVSESEVQVGVILYSLGESNPLLGIPPDADSIKMYNAVFDHYNQMADALPAADDLDPFELRRYVEEEFSPARMVRDYVAAYEKAIG